MGQKAAEMLRLVPETRIAVIERCSGHGGSWGVGKGNFEVALKVGKPVAKQAAKNASGFLTSECPLAGAHIVQGMKRLEGGEVPRADASVHPIELMARAYGLAGQ
jgi:glycerol-3-phosphate dehydrogenase subunit C